MQTLEVIGINQIQSFTIPPEYHQLVESERLRILEIIFHAYVKKYSACNVYFPIVELLRQEWRWQSGRGRTLPKRLELVLRKHKIILSNDTWGAIGNDIRETIPANDEYIFDITNNFGWKAGDFSDNGSCMFHGRREVKEQMEKDGRFYALRFYRPLPTHSAISSGAGDIANNWMINFLRQEGNKRIRHIALLGNQKLQGIARCWMFKGKVSLRKDNKVSLHTVYILFNSYGSIPLREMTTILTAKIGGATRRIPLSNQKREHGGLYVNGPGFIVGEPDVIENIEHFDFGLQNSYDIRQQQTTEAEIQENPYTVITPRSKKQKKKQATKKQKTRRYKVAKQSPLEEIAENYNSVHAYAAIARGIFSPKLTITWRKYYFRARRRAWKALIKVINYQINQRRYNVTTTQTGENS